MSISHIGLTLTPEAAALAPIERIKNPKPTSNKPKANFAGLDGSLDPVVSITTQTRGRAISKTSSLPIDTRERESVAEDPVFRTSFCKQVESGTSLLEDRPEYRCRDKQSENDE